MQQRPIFLDYTKENKGFAEQIQLYLEERKVHCSRIEKIHELHNNTNKNTTVILLDINRNIPERWLKDRSTAYRRSVVQMQNHYTQGFVFKFFIFSYKKSSNKEGFENLKRVEWVELEWIYCKDFSPNDCCSDGRLNKITFQDIN